MPLNAAIAYLTFLFRFEFRLVDLTSVCPVGRASSSTRGRLQKRCDALTLVTFSPLPLYPRPFKRYTMIGVDHTHCLLAVLLFLLVTWFCRGCKPTLFISGKVLNKLPLESLACMLGQLNGVENPWKVNF